MGISVPGLVESVDATRAQAAVRIGEARRVVSIEIIQLDGDVAPGDWLLVNGGLALERIDAREAEDFMNLFGDVVEDEAGRDGL